MDTVTQHRLMCLEVYELERELHPYHNVLWDNNLIELLIAEDLEIFMSRKRSLSGCELFIGCLLALIRKETVKTTLILPDSIPRDSIVRTNWPLAKTKYQNSVMDLNDPAFESKNLAELTLEEAHIYTSIPVHKLIHQYGKKFFAPNPRDYTINEWAKLHNLSVKYCENKWGRNKFRGYNPNKGQNLKKPKLNPFL